MKKMAGFLCLAAIGCHQRESGLESPPASSALCSATPRTVATFGGAVRSLARVGDLIYVAAGGVLWQISPATGAATALGASDGIFAADDDALVWTAGETRELYTLRAGVPADLGASLADFSGSYSMPLAGVAGGAALWADGTAGGGAYYALSLDGGAPVAHRLGDGWTYAAAWIANGERMAWIANGTLWSAAAPDAAAPTSLGPVAATSLLRIGAHDVYATVADAVAAYAFDGSSRVLARPMLAQDETTCGHPVGKYGVSTIIVADDESVYLATSSDCLDGDFAVSFWRADGSRLVGYAAASYSPLFVVDDACLYYTQDGSLMNVAR